MRLAHGLVQARVARGGRPLAIRWDALWSGLLATLGAIARERGGAAAATPEGARVVAQILNFLDFVLVKRRAACDAAEDVAPLLERIARASDVFERLEELAVKNGYAVGGSGGTSAGDRRATVPGARFANARRVLERVRVDEKDPDSIRVAAMHALATMDPLPTTDRLDADWALGTTIGGGRGREGSVRAAAAAAAAEAATTRRWSRRRRARSWTRCRRRPAGRSRSRRKD